MKTAQEVAELQSGVCSLHGSAFVACGFNEIAGFASKTAGLLPLNGLRHESNELASGWYLWCGEEFSDASDFFEPIHVFHLYEQDPEVAQLLGLAPGFRFLLAGGYLDVWFDERLLDLEEI
jgi:hypothetical protein